LTAVAPPIYGPAMDATTPSIAATSGSRPGAASADDLARVRLTAFGMILGLMVQFGLGMTVNLFVTVTRDHPGANPPEYFSGAAQSVVWAVTQGPFFVAAHVVWGTLLFVGGVVLVVSAWRTRRRGLRAATILGALMILGAGFNGASFLNYGEDFSSMLMATLFALAVVFYATAVFIATPE
jgi:hypothetical protein